MKNAAIILCAGKSTRMKSRRSKMLHELWGRPLCFWVLDQVAEAVDGPIVVVIGHQGEEIKAAIRGRYGDRISFALQSEARGTGDATQKGLALIPEVPTVLVMYGDTPLLKKNTLEDLSKLRTRQQAKIAMLVTHANDPTGYGRILRDRDSCIMGIVEEKEASPKVKKIKEINPGFYAFDTHFLREALPRLSSNNSQGELYLTDVVAMATQNVSEVVGLEVSFTETMGVNDRVDLANVSEILRSRIVREAMLQGVTCLQPDTTYIDADVVLSEDITLEPGVILRGKTILEENVRVGAYSIINDTVLKKGVYLQPHTVCEGAIVGENSNIGPFARLRPQTVLEADVKIGNFVEVKKSNFAKGAKANHLAYIGDSDVGAKSNIGAGTITCNYDGVQKHKTIIGEEVFIGSNTTLVAPVHIEKGAYVGAGSVITQNVPSFALGLGRARQENKEGYAEKLGKSKKAL